MHAAFIHTWKNFGQNVQDNFFGTQLSDCDVACHTNVSFSVNVLRVLEILMYQVD